MLAVVLIVDDRTQVRALHDAGEKDFHDMYKGELKRQTLGAKLAKSSRRVSKFEPGQLPDIRANFDRDLSVDTFRTLLTAPPADVTRIVRIVAWAVAGVSLRLECYVTPLPCLRPHAVERCRIYGGVLFHGKAGLIMNALRIDPLFIWVCVDEFLR